MSKIEQIDEHHTWDGGYNTHLNCTNREPWTVFKFRPDTKGRVNYCPSCGQELNS